MKKIVFSSTLIALLIVVGLAHAQQQIYSSDSTDMAEIDIPEVFVRSFKENTEINKLPATVSLVNARQIEQVEMQGLGSLTGRIANVFMPDYGSKLTSPIYIRGIGSRINSPSIGLYVDGVPYFEKAAFDFEFFDLDRIEVLKGPQGTLYGRNTMGGLINIFTKSPIKYQGTKLAATVGNYGHYKASATHYQKVSNKLGYMVGANYVHNDGFFTNAFDQSAVDQLNSISGRFKIHWQFAENWTAEFASNYEWSEQGGYPYAILDSTNTAGAINYDHYSSYQRNMLSTGLTLKYENDKFQFYSVTSHQYYDGSQDIDQDFTPADLYAIVQDEQQNMFYEELVLKSKGEQKYQWLVGGNAFVQLFDKNLFVDFGGDLKHSYDNYTKLYNNEIAGLAIFHQSTYQLTSNLKITGGLRVDSENDVQAYKYDILMRSGAEVSSADTIYPSLSFQNVLPRFAIDYQLNKQLSAFASVSKGYKSGGFNTTVTVPEELHFKAEHSVNYELGLKSFTADRKVNTNLSLFYINLTDQQIYQTVSTGRGSHLDNVGASNSKGIELELNANPTKNLAVNASYGYTNATIKDYYVNDSTNLAGNYIPYVPKHTLFLGANYSIDMNSTLEKVIFNVNYNGIGQHYWNEENTVAQDYYGMLNGKITLKKQDIAIELWGKNLLNTNYNAFYFEALGNSYVQKGRPLTFGVNVKYSF